MRDSRLPDTPLQGETELTNCDREPIHVPETIQPHGHLIAVDLSTRTIASASEHCGEVAAMPDGDLMGFTFVKAFPDLASQLAAVSTLNSGDHAKRQPFGNEKGSWIVSAHRCDGLAIFEFEAIGKEPAKVADLVGQLFIEIERQPLEDAYRTVVDRVRNFTGFDRVMLYQFLPDGHGNVIAESKNENQEAYLGLHYPATDIPLPARRLYELNWIRTIADTSAMPVPILHATPDQPRLNMTFSSLRAISPIHIEYLTNMGVGASMSISVMKGNQLWGLIACHHNSAKIVSPELRDACELCGSVLSAYLTSRRQQEYLRRQVMISDTIGEHLVVLTNFDDLAKGLERSAEPICGLLDADGLVWFSEEQNFFWGEVPNLTAVEEIATELSRRPEETVAYTEELRRWLPTADDYHDRLAGMLAIRLGNHLGGMLLFFRKPVQETILWAGNPEKSVTNESGRLTPRKSFAAWQKLSENKSNPWTEADRETANSLATGLQRMVVEKAERLRQANDELRRLNTDLDAFAYAASHDLKEPLRGIHHYVYLLERAATLSDDNYQSSMEGLKRIVKRMNDLLDGLLRFSRAGRADLNLETFPVEEVIDQAKDILFAGRQPDDVEIKIVTGGQLRGDFACVREIIGNLVTNAIKYNDSNPKRIEIAVLPTAETPLSHLPETGVKTVQVKDNGIGIAPEHHEQVFEIFRRLHDRDVYGGGSGAGLTIVRRMVERHGGTIAIESVGNGTSFYFTLGETE
ncbi:ATP-binding protein [Mariniblastus fucicola]|uniref:histidine kinase n=1 Tax=Mariniblastus fucicola TaxID=980251 RepID=A0A5B9P2X6_9BACT|nr:ATP-binding protein [Mariniblastus fucicola]QEG20718.1 Phytochrome-like protein cph1 [Mariniblastus fucicola]